jgi:anti-anti-sigma factor
LISEFSVEVEELENGLRVFRILGELDHATAPKLRDPLDAAIQAGVSRVLIDLTDCPFIDSTGLSVIVHARTQLVDDGEGRFELCCADAQTRRLLEITGIEEAFGIFDTRDQALAAFVA